jgi:methylated-DNA-[protein]-cysteine S-methyltransferase
MVEWEMPEADITKLTEQRYHVRIIHDESRTLEVINQLADYLNGTRCQFSLALDFSGMSSFQENVLRLTSQIPYGETRTYKEIAVQIGKENAARAVGRVEATNPMPLIIPCHRVLGSDGTLHGYGGPGGIKLKAWLLELEKSPLK